MFLEKTNTLTPETITHIYSQSNYWVYLLVPLKLVQMFTSMFQNPEQRSPLSHYYLQLSTDISWERVMSYFYTMMITNDSLCSLTVWTCRSVVPGPILHQRARVLITFEPLCEQTTCTLLVHLPATRLRALKCDFYRIFKHKIKSQNWWWSSKMTKISIRLILN